jgi:DNA-3-methyladenine glycosylase
MNNKLPREFYKRPALDAAKDILGKILVHESSEGVTAGRIVEVEAYIGPEDRASHAYNNLRTTRTEIQFGEGGFAYIYLIYGMYYCFNIVTGEINSPEVIFIRAIEPLKGLDLMFKRRGWEKDSGKKLNSLCDGPGKLCTAMGITKDLSGSDLSGGPIYVTEDDSTINSDFEIVATPRINIDYAGADKHLLWRFIIANSDYISMKKLKK